MSVKSTSRGKLVSEEELDTLRGWFPVAIEGDDSKPSVLWRYLGNQRFTHPFFEDSLAAISPDLRLSCLTSSELLTRFHSIDCLEPSAFLFHASRCGSTLMTQLLAALPQCVVISEAPVIDSAVNLCRSPATRDHGIDLLKGVVRAFGQRRFEDERHLFIKLDSWHIIHLSLIRAAFPNTPFFFVYRRPSEIFLSHRRQRGSQMVPGLLNAELLGLDSNIHGSADLDGYCLRVLSNIFRFATEHARSAEILLINYRQLPALIWTGFAKIVSLSMNAAEVQQMQDRSLRHSKLPIGKLVEDLSQHMPEDVDVPGDLESYYDDLERFRLSKESQ